METYYFPSREFPSHPTNLEKKVKLWFNLPLLHTFAEKFISELVYESQSEYFRKGDGKKSQMRKIQIRNDLCLCRQIEKAKKRALKMLIMITTPKKFVGKLPTPRPPPQKFVSWGRKINN